jgi:hypothetical protein
VIVFRQINPAIRQAKEKPCNRFAGTCYKAANWINVGQTKGRGKLGPPWKINVPIKDIWVYPLIKEI